MVANLQKEIEENQVTIAALGTTIEEQKVVIKTTQESLDLSREVLISTEAKLQHTAQLLEDTRNTAYFVAGNAKELKAKNIISRYGLFFKKNALTSEFDIDDFMKIDITKVDNFSFNNKPQDIVVIPPRQFSSYKLEEMGKGKSVLQVLDRGMFWKVPYLVVVTD